MAIVRLPIEQEFLDVMGEPWTASRDLAPMGLRAVLQHTIRRCPVKTGGDAERAYDILKAVRASDNGAIEMRKEEFDWMVVHFREMAHQVWLAPDAAYLVHYLEDHVVHDPA